MSNLYSGQTQMAMSPMYGMSQPQLPMIPGGSYFDPYAGMGGFSAGPAAEPYMGGFGGGMGGTYSMFGSYNAMPDYTGGYMQGFGQQLPSQFGYQQPVSQFGGGMGGGYGNFGMPQQQFQQPNVNDLFGQYMFGQYYGMPAFNPFQQTSMFGGGGRRGFGQPSSRRQMQQQQQSPFGDLELDIDALRAALGLTGTNQMAQNPREPEGPPRMNQPAAPQPAPPPAAMPPPMQMPQQPFDLNAFNQLTQGNLPSAPPPAPAAPPPMAAPPPPPAPVAPPAAPAAPPPQIPPNLNLFVPGFSGPEMPQTSMPETGGGRFYIPPPEPEVVMGVPQPVPALETGGGRPYTPPPQEVFTAVPQPVPMMPEFMAPSPPPVAPPRAPAFNDGAMQSLLAARQAAQNARARGFG